VLGVVRSDTTNDRDCCGVREVVCSDTTDDRECRLHGANPGGLRRPPAAHHGGTSAGVRRHASTPAAAGGTARRELLRRPAGELTPAQPAGTSAAAAAATDAAAGRAAWGNCCGNASVIPVMGSPLTKMTTSERTLFCFNRFPGVSNGGCSPANSYPLPPRFPTQTVIGLLGFSERLAPKTKGLVKDVIRGLEPEPAECFALRFGQSS